ncbi:Tspear, partial [Symbiodinium sp. CCMP2456]
FAFADVGAWSLVALGGYLAVLSLLVLMAKLWTKAGSQRPRQPAEAQALGRATESLPESVGPMRPSQAEQRLAETREMPLKRKLKRSRQLFAATMFLESGNLVSTMLYAVEAFQRATLVDFSVACGSAVLMPLTSAHCPSTSEILQLPLCDSTLSLNTLCEADAEVLTDNCQVFSPLDNCKHYDVYRKEEPACEAIGCAELSYFLWMSALICFGATVGCIAAFYARCLWVGQRQEARRLQQRFAAFFIFLGCLIMIALLVGLTAGNAAVLSMVFLCPLMPISAWALAGGIAFLPAAGEEAIVNQAAGLELPFFNVFLALQLTEDDVEDIRSFRETLDTGLRVVEDVPEIVIGLLDLVYFGGAWYTWLGIGMSLAMVAVHLAVGFFLSCKESAMQLAEVRRNPRDRE